MEAFMAAWTLRSKRGITLRLASAAAPMCAGVYLHLTEEHGHAHVHEPLDHEHAHIHRICATGIATDPGEIIDNP